MRRFLGPFVGLLLAFFVSGVQAAPPAGYNSSQSWQDALKSIQTQQEGLKSADAVQDKLFTPATNEQVDFYTMDGSQSFKASYSCRTSNPILVIKTAIGAGGELTAEVRYSPQGDGGSSQTLVVGKIAGACVGGAVFECNPSGSWSKCKYGQFQFTKWRLELSATFPSGEPRDPVGMRGCFCFSNHCGGTAATYMETILRHMGQGIIDLIMASNRNLIVSAPKYDAGTASMTWHTGNVDDCTPLGATNISELTKQYGRMDLDYQKAINEQESGSAWDILSKSMQQPRNIYACTKKAKAASEFKQMVRKIDATFGIGWDRDGGSKDCYWFTTGGSCGHAFGEPRSWDACVSQAYGNFSRICSELYVNSGHFTSITNVANPRAISGLANRVNCYGAGNDDYDQLWMMECWGTRYDDYFVCNSSKSADGKTFTNDDPKKYDGCSEIRPIENGCAELEKRDDCYLIDEKVDGLYTVMSSTNTGMAPTAKCKEVKGVRSSIVVCEPWWQMDRRYECKDPVDGFDKEKERTAHVTQNIGIDQNKYLSSVGDLQFGLDGKGARKVIDVNFQFDNQLQPCTPACVVQRDAAKYTMVLPGQRQTGENADEHIGNNVEQSIIPGGNSLLIKTLDCVSQGTAYVCPVEQGWSLRSQCSCADGQEFAQAITTLMALNEVSKDLICSTGQTQGVCDAEEAGQQVYRVACGDYSKNAAGIVVSGDTWDCSPKLWKGTVIPGQRHYTTVDKAYHCRAWAEGLPEDDNFENDLGGLVPQKGWFDEAIVWARSLIAQESAKAREEWFTSVKCGCPGFANEIDICQPAPKTSNYLCLQTRQKHATYAACRQNCAGRATSSKEAGICVWKDAADSPDAAPVAVAYNLKLQPENKAIFGEVQLNHLLYYSLEKGDAMPYCADKSVRDVAEPYIESGTCTTSSQSVCFLNGDTYQSPEACASGCSRSRYRCKASGRIVDEPAQCSTISYECSSTKTRYSSNEACQAACVFDGVTNSQICASSTNSRAYGLYLKESGQNLVQALDYVPTAGQRQTLKEDAYPYYARIAQQCADRHLTPFINYTEPGTNAHFEYAHVDLLAFQYAAAKKQISSENGQLPKQPPVYRGSAMRQADINNQKQEEDIVRDDTDSVTTVPRTDLTPEQLKELENKTGQTSIGQNGQTQADPQNQAVLVPRTPMFLNKTWSLTYRATGTGFGKLGGHSIDLGPLSPFIYYHECPRGSKQASASNSCGGKPPFGGVVETIAGKWCFQFHCDDTAKVETDANQYSGCGLVNDGWKR